MRMRVDIVLNEDYYSCIQIVHLEKLRFSLVQACVDKPPIHCCNQSILHFRTCQVEFGAHPIWIP